MRNIAGLVGLGIVLVGCEINASQSVLADASTVDARRTSRDSRADSDHQADTGADAGAETDGSPTRRDCPSTTPDRCGDRCVASDRDPQNCGTCGHVCAGSQVCVSGMCQGATGCDPANDTCAQSTYCDPISRECRAGCNRDQQCSSGRTCNTQSHVCECRTGLTLCGGSCVACPALGQGIATVGCVANSCAATSCTTGYTSSGNGCVDVNECAINNGGCNNNATCFNTPGGSECRCNAGFQGNGFQCTASCTPMCTGRSCGSDGCGGTCGTCALGGGCTFWGQCEPFSTQGSATATYLSLPFNAHSFGSGVRLSSDGGVIAVRYSREPVRPAVDHGHVAIYTRAASAWSAPELLPEPAQTGVFGSAMAFSYDGNVLAVGDANGGASERGAVTVYTRNGSAGAWMMQSITRPTASFDFGASVTLSSDGATLAVGDFNGGVEYNGTVSVYVRSGMDWQLQATLSPPANSLNFGVVVSASADGNTIAVGDGVGGGDRNGAVAMFYRTGTSWSGPSLLYRPPGVSSFGGPLLASDGRTMVVISSQVHVFARSPGPFGDWAVVTRLTTTDSPTTFGSSLGISADGTIIAVGNPSARPGRVTMFGLQNASWSNLGSIPVTSYYQGASMALSADARVLVVGDPEARNQSNEVVGEVMVSSRP